MLIFKPVAYFLKALLPNPNRRIPNPSATRVIGHGSGQPNRGFGVRVAISTASSIRRKPAIISRTFEAVSM
jgi:hypothetical protein